MSNYSDQLAALGLPPEVVNRYLQANDMQKFSNLEHENYGVLTNEQRAQLLRAVLPSPTYNEHNWPHCQAQRYEYDETLDGQYPSTDTYGS